VPKPENIIPHKWQPGQSGNPAGYSRSRRTTDALLRLIDEKGADDAIARVWLKRVLEGDFRYFKELLERTEGKTSQPIEVKTSPTFDGGDVRKILDDPEAVRLACDLDARLANDDRPDTGSVRPPGE
jgi:hypothetical protein